MITVVPPAAGPEVVLEQGGPAGDRHTLLTRGPGAAPDRYVNWSDADVADVPAPVVTVTSTVPAPAGDVALICVDEVTVTPVAAVVPNLTPVTPVKLVPVMVTPVPPAAGPLPGDTPVTVGAVLVPV
jgi:hypothetical protein